MSSETSRKQKVLSHFVLSIWLFDGSFIYVILYMILCLIPGVFLTFLRVFFFFFSFTKSQGNDLYSIISSAILKENLLT